jgi:signal peptidase
MTRFRPLSRRGLHVVAALLFVALVVPFVVYAVPEVAGADESYIVLTASMTPEIAPGDAVVVREVPPGQVQAGDVITFLPRSGGDVPITHRVVDVLVLSDGSRAFVTKGDANEDADAGAVTPEQVVGKVVLTLPYVGHVVAFVNTPVGFGVLVVLPIGLLILTEVGDVVFESRRAGTSEDEPATVAYESEGTAVEQAADTEVPDGTLAVTRADLTFTAVALVAFAIYAIFVAAGDFTPLSIAVAVGVVSTLGLVVVLRQSIPTDSTDDAETSVSVAAAGDDVSESARPASDTPEVDA